MSDKIGNNFGYMMYNTSQRRQAVSNTGLGQDLRSKYSTSAQFEKFDQALRARGTNYNQFKQMQWNMKMDSIQRQEIAKYEAINSTATGFSSIVNSLKSIFGI